MAASTPPDRPADEDDQPEPPVGMSHPTVVPANFESVEGDDGDGRDE